MKGLTPEQRAVRKELRANVRGFMRDAEKFALEKIDRLQLAGVDIIGDHMKADGPFQVPREFIAAFAEEMKYQYGWIMKHDPASRKRRIKNYYLMM